MKRQSTDHPDMKVIITKKGDMGHKNTPHTHVRLETDTAGDRFIVRDGHQTDVKTLWNGEQPTGLPPIDGAKLPLPEVDVVNSMGGVTITLTITNVFMYTIYPNVLFYWIMPDGTTQNGPTVTYTYPNYPSTETITVQASNQDYVSSVAIANLVTLPDPVLPVPDTGTVQSFSDIEDRTHTLNVANMVELSNYQDGIIHWANLTTGVIDTGDSKTYTYPAYPYTTQYEIWFSAMVNGVRFESSRHTVTYDTKISAIIGPIVETTVLGVKCTTGTSSTVTIGGAISSTGNQCTYYVYDISSGVTITPTTWFEGDEVVVATDYTPSAGDPCEYTVKVVDGVNPDLTTRFSGGLITVSTTINVVNVTKVLVSGVDCKGNGSGVFTVSGATSSLSGATITHTASNLTPGVTITPMTWVEGDNITISVDGTVNIGDTAGFTDTITDGSTTGTRSLTCLINEVIQIDGTNFAKTRLTGTDCVGLSGGTFNIDGVVSPNGIITYVASSVTNGTTLDPMTWDEDQPVDIAIDGSVSAGDTSSFIVTATDEGGASVAKTFSCVISVVDVDVSAATIHKTLISGTTCSPAGSGTMYINGATGGSGNFTYTVSNLSNGITVSPSTWTENDILTVAVANGVTIGSTVQFNVTATDDAGAFDGKTLPCVVQFNNSSLEDIVLVERLPITTLKTVSGYTQTTSTGDYSFGIPGIIYNDFVGLPLSVTISFSSEGVHDHGDGGVSVVNKSINTVPGYSANGIIISETQETAADFGFYYTLTATDGVSSYTQIFETDADERWPQDNILLSAGMTDNKTGTVGQIGTSFTLTYGGVESKLGSGPYNARVQNTMPQLPVFYKIVGVLPTGIAVDQGWIPIGTGVEVTALNNTPAGTWNFDVRFSNGSAYPYIYADSIDMVHVTDIATSKFTPSWPANDWVYMDEEVSVSGSYAGVVPYASGVFVHFSVTNGTITSGNDTTPGIPCIIQPDNTVARGTNMNITYEVIANGGSSTGDTITKQIGLYDRLELRDSVTNTIYSPTSSVPHDQAFNVKITGGPKLMSAHRMPILSGTGVSTQSGTMPSGSTRTINVGQLPSFSVASNAQYLGSTIDTNTYVFNVPEPVPIIIDTSSLVVTGIPNAVSEGDIIVCTISGGNITGAGAPLTKGYTIEQSSGWYHYSMGGCSSAGTYNHGQYVGEGQTHCFAVSPNITTGIRQLVVLLGCPWGNFEAINISVNVV